MPRFAALCLILWVAPAVAQEGPRRGTIQLHVTALGSAMPVPFADVVIASERFTAFTDSAGRLTIRHLPTTPLEIRVRRIGFRPVVTTVTPSAAGSTPVLVALPEVALRLATVRVSDDVCPGSRSADTAVIAILQQAQLNAERYAMLVQRYPFVVTMERVLGEQGNVPHRWSGRAPARRGDRVVQAWDTLEVTGRSEWRYAPGKLFAPTGDSSRGVATFGEKMTVPHLVDFADDAFVATHCFRYMGLANGDSARVIRVDFRPTRSVRTPDVRGSLYFDAQSFQILKTTLFADRRVPSRPDTDWWVTRVDAWFTEVEPGIPVLSRIESTTSLETTRRGVSSPFVATEDHRMLELRFVRERPGEGTFSDDSALAGTTGDARSPPCPTSPRAAPSVDSSSVLVDGMMAKLCYMNTPDGGEDEMTLLLAHEMEVAGVVLPAGSYRLRAFFGPARQVLRIFAGDSAGPDREIGRGTVMLETSAATAERFVVRADTTASEPAFVLEWRALRARIPLWSRQ